jgi:two-component system, OmpR family, sensor histidine kinase BaeS
MRKLSTRLALAMIAVGLATLVIFSTLESLAFVREYRQLPLILREPFRPGAGPKELDFLSQLSPRLREVYLERTQLYTGAIQDFARVRRRTFFLSALIALMLGMLLALIFSRRIAQPIAAVSKAASDMKQGKLSARVEQAALKNADEETLVLSQSFNDMADTLEKNELERKNMIADIAHELRTPLAIMQARLAAMQDDVIPLNISEIERVYRQTELLSRLVADLRTLSLAETGRLSLQKREVDLSEVLQSVISSFETSANLKNVQLEFTAQHSVLVHADADRLTQVFGNLLDNALRYTPENKRIEVRLESAAETASIYIHDAGPGLSTEALGKVFDRFYKADERSGSGLGLAIVKTLVELQGGLVTVSNHPESGAVFEVRLARV